MAVHIGDTAPDFTQDSTEGVIDFHAFLGDSWGILFSHPADFTPVCTTELGTVARLKPAFDRRGVKVIGLSVDGLSDHKKWSADIAETQGTALNFPLLADADRSVANLYDMIPPKAANNLTVRSVFFIDPAKRVRLILTYPASVGRNFQEILRAIDALQTADRYGVATPADWVPGQDCIIPPSVSNDDAAKKFPQGFTEIKPYLRTVAIKDQD